MPACQMSERARPNEAGQAAAGQDLTIYRQYGRVLSRYGDVVNQQGRTPEMNYEEICTLSCYTSLGFATGVLTYVLFQFVRGRYFRYQ